MTSLDAVIVKEEDVKRHYICVINEHNGEYEYGIKFLMTCKAGEDPEEKLNAVLLEWRDGGEREDDLNLVWYDGGVAASSGGWDEIPVSDYEVLKKHLNTLSEG